MASPRRLINTIVLVLALLSAPAAANATRCLVVEVAPTPYGAQVDFVVTTLRNAGAVVDVLSLSSSASTVQLDVYDQIWVIDFSPYDDDAPVQLFVFRAIASWFNAKKRHVIVDSRLQGSSYNFGTSEYGYAPDTGRPETNLIDDYYFNFVARGTGLYLGTDHDVFAAGINQVNTQIGIGQFYGYIYEEPYLARIDETSSVVTWPYQAGHHPFFIPPQFFIWADSSVSYVPVGVQANGRSLIAIANYGGNTAKPVVSTTIRGPSTFSVTIDVPTHTSAPYVAYGSGPLQLHAVPSAGVAPFTYSWSSTVGGTFGTGQSATLASLATSQTVTVTVTDDDNVQSSTSLVVWSGLCSSATQCPSGMFCADDVCCNAACAGGANDCFACSVAAGGPTNGVCTTRTTGSVCDDGNACTTGDHCLGGLTTCTPSGELDCIDDTVCTDDSCSPSSGCVHAPVTDGTICDDGDACTSADACSEGVCAGADIICTADQCHAPACDSATGCFTSLVTDGIGCDDGDACTVSDTCVAGVCTAGSARDCATENPCQSGSCDSVTGCGSTPVVNGTVCPGGLCELGFCLQLNHAKSPPASQADPPAPQHNPWTSYDGTSQDQKPPDNGCNGAGVTPLSMLALVAISGFIARRRRG